MTLEEIQSYFDRIETENLWQALLFDAKLAKSLLDERYIYYSSLRPFAALPALRNAMKLTEADVLANVITRKGQEFGVVLTMEPLPRETVEAFDLLLDRYHTYAPLLQQYVGDKPAIAFREPPGARTDWGYLLFRNPRGNWQLSTFQPELGPIGHTESKDKYELLRETLRYRPDSGAYVEAIMSTATGSVPLDGFAGDGSIWSLMRDGAMFKLAVTVGGRFDHSPLEERSLLLSATPDGSLHGHVYDTKYRLPLEGTVRFDHPRGHFTFFTQYGERSGFVGEDWTDNVLVEDALAALQVWLDGLIERGLVE